MHSQKRHRQACTPAAEAKMLVTQRRALNVNRALLLLMAGKAKECHEALDAVQKEFGPNGEDLLMARAALAIKEKRPDDALSTLQTLASAGPGLTLTICQLLLAKGDVNGVCAALKSLLATKVSPGAVSALVGLLRASGKADEAAAVLDSVVDAAPAGQGSIAMLWDAVRLHTSKGRPREAAAALEKLLTFLDGASRSKAVATLVSLVTQFDPEKAERLSSRLPPLPSASGVDVDSLEAAPRRARTTTAQDDASTASVERKPKNRDNKDKKKKKKKIRLPKNYNPNVAPDPERWLPKHLRTNFKKGGVWGGAHC